MAYTPHNWDCNELITNDKLNQMEQAIATLSQQGGEPLIVNLTENIRDASCEDYVYSRTDKSYQVIRDAYLSGRLVYFLEPNGTYHTVVVVDNTSVGIMSKEIDGEGVSRTIMVGFIMVNGVLQYPVCSI